MRRLLVGAMLLAWAGCVSEAPVLSRPPSAGPYVALLIEESPLEVVSWAGEPLERQLHVLGVRADGARERVTGTAWRLEGDPVAQVNESGLLSVSGQWGGELQVRAEAVGQGGQPLTATGEVSVRSHWEVIADGLGEEVIDVLADAPFDPEGALAPELVYPLNGAVMPDAIGVLPVHFRGDGPGDLFQVVFATEHVEVVAAASREFGELSVQLQGPPLRALAESDPGGQVEIWVERLEAQGQRRHRGDEVFIEFRPTPWRATASFVAWNDDSSRIWSVEHGVLEQRPLFDEVPEGPGGDRCEGCHSVSSSTDRTAVTLYDDPRGLLFEADRQPAPLAQGAAFHFPAFHPDRDLMAAVVDGELQLVDAVTRQPILEESDVGTHPAWSTDGRRLAFVTHGGDPVNFADSELLVADFDGDALGEPRLLHEGIALEEAPEGGATDSHPTLSDDGTLLAFAHGEHSTLGVDGVEFQSALYMMAGESGTPVRLARALPGGAASAGWPVFTPFVSRDGTRWLAFISRQDVGNEWAGTAGQRLRQVWMTAIDPDADIEQGQDPSHVPFWWPAQHLNRESLPPQFVAQQCLPEGAACRAQSDCCQGRCVVTGDEPEERVCQP